MKNIVLHFLFLLLCSALTFTGIAASPNAASNYFNEAAFLYTDQKTDEALDLTKQGLELYPDNLPLIKLKELLEKQQEQEQEQQQQQQEQEQQQKEQQQKQDQQDKDDQQKKQEQQQHDQQEKEENKQEKDQQNKPEQNQEQQERRAEEMTPEEAQLLLDAMRDDEKAQRDAMRMIMGAPEPAQNGKDW